MAPRSYVRWESWLTPGKWFTGQVVFTHEDRAVVRDPTGKFPKCVIQLNRLQYIPRASNFA